MTIPVRKAVFVGFVRIHATNKSIRATVAGGAIATYSFAEGLYWFGLNGPMGGPSDTTLAGAASLLDAMHTMLGVHLAVCHPNVPAVDALAPGYTGHLYGKRGVAGDTIHWSNALTTVDPRWFGMLKTADAYSDTAFGAAYADISQASSSAVFIPQSNIRSDRESVEPLKQTTDPDSGASRSAYYGAKQYRSVDVRVSGLPLETVDCTYQSLRRFITAQPEALLFWPDICSVALPNAPPEHDYDSTDRMNGRQKLIFDPRWKAEWREKPAFGNYYSEWFKSLMFQQYVA
jgi:hypothetical protein